MTRQLDLFAAENDWPTDYPFGRAALLVTGPNASGKSTAVDEALDGFQTTIIERKSDELTPASVVVVHADSAMSDGPTAELPARLLKVWDSPATVIVIEGTNRAANAFAEAAKHRDDRKIKILLTRTSPDAMLHHLRTRCAKNGKRFRDDYWDEKRCRYEGTGRYINLAERQCTELGIGYTVYEIDKDYSGIDALKREVRETVRWYATG